MQDIVEDALANAEMLESNPDSDNFELSDFGTPICAVVGCGPAGIDRVEMIETADATLVIGNASTLDRELSEDYIQIPVKKCGFTNDFSRLNDYAFESGIIGTVGAPDIVIVSGHLEDLASVRLLKTVCEQFSSETTVIAVPSIPKEGISTTAAEIFHSVVDVTGIVVPYDLGQVSEVVGEESMGSSLLGMTDHLIAELISNICDTIHGCITVSPLPFGVAHDLFNNGGVSLVCWGWAERDDDPEEVINQISSTLLCNGSLATATGGYGFLQFDETFTLEEFESVETAAKQAVRPDSVGDDRWVFCGDSISNDSKSYCLTYLAIDVDINSINLCK